MFEDSLIESKQSISPGLRWALVISLIVWIGAGILVSFVEPGSPATLGLSALSLVGLISLIVCLFRTKIGKKLILSYLALVGFLVILVLLPLIFIDALPTKQLMTMLTAPPPPPPPPPPPAAAPVVVKKIQSELDNGQLRTPTAIPKKVQMIKEDEPPPSAGPAGVVGGVPGGVPGGAMGGVLGSVMSGVPTAVPKAATPTRVRVSQGVSQGLLVHKVQPQYPPLARQARIQGVVVLQALIGKDGNIQNLHVVSGHPMLTNAALEAVKEWRYKPYYLNGEPVEVETTINVNFTLSGD